ncbi:MAG: COQ9 family protein [Rickettsiaceae bacterium]|nr:COQ9 family protein [Rickettsiaceae bacterium]
MTDFAKKHAEAKIKLFQSLAKNLEQEAWSKELIAHCELECKMSPGYHHILFLEGGAQMLDEFESWQDDIMLQELMSKERPQKIREQIALALETRIINIISKNALIHISSALALPSKILVGSEASCRTCDAIWKYAGDKSTDFNFYTKRGLLLPVYLSAKAFYISDESDDHKDTKEFIKNALDNIINIASLKNRIHLPKLEDIPILRLFS